MARLLVGVVPDTADKYSTGNDASVWIHPKPITAAYPKPTETLMEFYNFLPNHTVDSHNGNALVPLGFRIPNGYYMRCEEVPPAKTPTGVYTTFQVDARDQPLDAATSTYLTPLNATNIKYAPDNSVRTQLLRTQYIELLPLFSVESLDMDQTAGTYTIRNIQSQLQKLQIRESIETKISFKGYKTKGDTMMKLISNAMNNAEESIFMRIIFPDFTGYDLIAQVTGDKLAFKVGEGYMTDVQLVLSSQPVIRDFTPS